MAEINASQVQQTEFFKKMMDEQLTRTTSMLEEMAKLEATSAEQARAAVDEAAKLAKESIAYAGKLNAEWRKLSLDAMRKAAELWSPKA